MSFFARSAAALAAALLLSQPATAEPGFYAGAFLGIVWNGDQTLDGAAGAPEVSLEEGGDLSVFAGYNFGAVGPAGSLRTELQFSGRAADVKRITGGAGPVTGTFEEGAAFVNVLYDFDHTGTRFVPYVGAGFGHAELGYKNYGTAGGQVLDGTDEVWGAQAIAGLGYDVSEKVRIFADYRYRDYRQSRVATTTGGAARVDADSASLNLGFLYAF
ncbi:outer membrane protein [Meridianimarinicoccus roseus]|nr:outer membrane beta-barrel protein [Meridianimarinicoccus roseus]